MPVPHRSQVDPTSQRQTKVLYVDHAPVVGGAELSLIELVQTLDPEFRAAIACNDECPEFLKQAAATNAPLFTMRMPCLKDRASIIALAMGAVNLCGIIRRFKPDIVHTNTVRAHIVGSVAAAICRVPTVWSLRDYTFPRPLYRLLLPLASRVICVSDSIKKCYKRSNSQKLSTVLNGIVVPTLDARAERIRIRKELEIPEQAPVIGTVGQLTPWKGQENFLKAASRVKDRVADARFLIVGDGQSDDYKMRLEELADNDHLRGSVIFTGFRRDALSCMCAADVIVHTSTEPEAFGRVLIEGMALGVPVIASPLGGPAEIIEEGVSGLLVSSADTDALAEAIHTVITDAEVASRLSIGGRSAFLARFDQVQETQSIQHIYRTLLEEQRGPR